MSSDTVFSFISEYAKYFREKGYSISDTFEMDMCGYYYALFSGNVDLGEVSVKELKDIFRTFTANSEGNDKAYDKDYTEFLEDYKYRKADTSKIDSSEARKKLHAFSTIEERDKENSKRLSQCEKEVKKIKSNIDNIEHGNIASESVIKKHQKQYDRIKTEYDKLAAFHPSGFTDFMTLVKNNLYSEISSLKPHTGKLLENAFRAGSGDDVLDYVSWQLKTIETACKTRPSDLELELESKQKALQKLKDERENIDSILKDKEENFHVYSYVVRKSESHKHRPSFTTGHNSVQSTYEGDYEIPDVQFAGLSSDEKMKIRGYLKDNAVTLKTALTKRIITSSKQRIDIEQTCKKACGTDGIPLKLIYTKPKRERPKLVLMLDISGSCREASEMLVCFAHSLRESFKGGCKIYAFVNSLTDVSSMFDCDDPEDAFKAVLDAIPTRGVYSDYYTPLRSYVSERISEIDKNTYFILLGDARNNNNPSGEEYVKKISEKAKRAYIFNSEEKDSWGVNDSVTDIYGKYMSIKESLTPKQLLGHMMNI